MAVAVVMAVVAACSAHEPTDAAESDLAVEGRWTPPADIKAIGARVRLEYDAAPRWTGTAACGGRLLSGSRKLGQFLAANFDGIESIGGYACRRNTADGSRMSVHGTGRALDVMIPMIQNQADNGKGDKIANWLIVNAQRIGIQLIIWDHSVWRANGTNDAPYGGPIPHTDHLHVELTEEAAAEKTPWFVEGAGDAGDASTAMDATTTHDATTTLDAGSDTGATHVDAGHDAGVKIDSGADAGTAPVDAGADATDGGPSDTTPPSTGGTDPGTGTGDLPDDEEPTEKDPSIGGSTSAKKRATSEEGDDPSGSSGCSSGASSPREPFGLASSMLVLVAALFARRRRR